MYNGKVKELINKIEDIAIIENHEVIGGSIQSRMLPLLYLGKECQIFEAIDKDGKEISMPLHVHEHSREIFYQVRGETTFSDGTILKEGEVKIIEMSEPHSPKIGPGGAMIVIVHPLEKAYEVANG